MKNNYIPIWVQILPIVALLVYIFVPICVIVFFVKLYQKIKTIDKNVADIKEQLSNKQ